MQPSPRQTPLRGSIQRQLCTRSHDDPVHGGGHQQAPPLHELPDVHVAPLAQVASDSHAVRSIGSQTTVDCAAQSTDSRGDAVAS